MIPGDDDNTGWVFVVSIVWIVVLCAAYVIPVPPPETKFFHHPFKYAYRNIMLCFAAWYCVFAATALVLKVLIGSRQQASGVSIAQYYQSGAVIGALVVALTVVIELFIEPCRQSILCCKCCCCACCNEADAVTRCARFCSERCIPQQETRGFQHQMLTMVISVLFSSVITAIADEQSQTEDLTRTIAVFAGTLFVAIMLSHLFAGYLASIIMTLQFSIVVSGGITFASAFVNSPGQGFLGRGWGYYLVLATIITAATFINQAYNWCLREYWNWHRDVRDHHRQSQKQKSKAATKPGVQFTSEENERLLRQAVMPPPQPVAFDR